MYCDKKKNTLPPLSEFKFTRVMNKNYTFNTPLGVTNLKSTVLR